MFELIEKLLTHRDYDSAGGILSALGNMTRTPADELPQGFCDAQIRIVPLQHSTHLFVAITDKQLFWSLPGDTVNARTDGDTLLMSKMICVSELFSGAGAQPLQIHFLYTESDRGNINA